MNYYLPHKIFVCVWLFLLVVKITVNNIENTQNSVTTTPVNFNSRVAINNQNTVTDNTSSLSGEILGYSKYSTSRSRKVSATLTPKPTLNPTVTRAPTPTLSTTPSQIVTVMPTPVVTNNLKWGAYTGWSSAQASSFETRVGNSMDLVATFVHWGNENEFPQDLADFALRGGKTLVIYWEAMDYNNPSVDNNPRYSYDEILRGGWDGYFTSFSNSVKSYKGNVIIIPFEEANGDWYPWSATKNNNSVTKYIAAFRYVHNYFKGYPNIKVAWDINQESVPSTSENSISNYYPGNDYVDYVGVNGFNFGNPWLTFDQIFGRALPLLSSYNKPVYIFSMACAPGVNKPAWIEDALNVQMKKYPSLAGWIWFSENKEKNWLPWSDANSLATFSKYLP